jgi:hypothetical protein
LFFFIFAFKTEYSILLINILSFISTSHPLYISDPSKQTNRGAHSSFPLPPSPSHVPLDSSASPPHAPLLELHAAMHRCQSQNGKTLLQAPMAFF